MINEPRRPVGALAHINWAMIDQVVVSGANFLTGILLARFLGLEEFGRFTVAWLFVLFLNSIQFAAISAPMMSIGPKQPAAEAKRYFGAVVAHQVVVSCLSFLLMFTAVKATAAVVGHWDISGLALPLATAAFICQMQDFVRRYFFTHHRVVAALATDVTRYVGQIAVLAWLYHFVPGSMNVSATFWVLSITAGVATIIGAFLFGPIALDVASARQVVTVNWKTAKWLAPSAILQWHTGHIFMLVAGGIYGASAVGAMRAAQNLIAISHVLLQGWENVIPTRAAWHLVHGGVSDMVRYVRRVVAITGPIMLTIAAVAIATPNFWLGLVFGDEFEGYGYLLRWWAVAYLFVFLELPLKAILRALEFARPIFVAAALAGLLSVLTVYPLTKFLGLSGSMLGFTCVNVLSVMYLWINLRKRLK